MYFFTIKIKSNASTTKNVLIVLEVNTLLNVVRAFYLYVSKEIGKKGNANKKKYKF